MTGARTAPSRLLDFDAPESLPSSAVAAADTAYLPHVVAWNLTRRCNLRCSHGDISKFERKRSDTQGEHDLAGEEDVVEKRARSWRRRMIS